MSGMDQLFYVTAVFMLTKFRFLPGLAHKIPKYMKIPTSSARNALFAMASSILRARLTPHRLSSALAGGRWLHVFSTESCG